MVNDVLTLARIEAGKVELDEQTVTLSEVIGASIRPVANEAASKSISIVDDGGGDVLVRLDPNRMKQVLVNLLSNAVKFNRQGGSIRVSAALEAAGTPVIHVRDTGNGIPPDHLGRVFEPFSQVEDHLTRENEGIGLGLPLARAMVRLHGGDLTLTSQVGIGTLAEITLPASRLSSTSAG
jgi:two-component system cell cycle sensor histidine kinase PleC